MNFSYIDFDDATKAFYAELMAFLDEHATEEVHDEEHRTGAGLNEGFHHALGAKGWILPTWPKDKGGAGLTQLQAAILQREIRARHLPTITAGTTQLVLPAVLQYADQSVQDEVVPGVAKGGIRFCLGYTEPDNGSDLAGVRTRATQDGDEWVIDGQKMFTTGAQNCQYAFLLARSNPDKPKHKGLTMFLCPLDGVEIQAVHTLGGERTNMVFFDGLRISDRYRLGPVDSGWMVLSGPLNAEHGIGRHVEYELDSPGGMYASVGVSAYEHAVDWAAAPGVDGRRPIDDPVVRRRLALAAVDIEASTVAPGPMGRIVSSETFIRYAEDLISMVGPRGLLPRGEQGAIANGWIEYAHRFAQGTATYGGTTDIHRNIIAERILGLPRSTASK
ncbi:MAG: acyl-CoA dehydrogenase family protein [Acidimicrobiia bacterium]